MSRRKFRTKKASLLISSASSLQESSWKMDAHSRITTSKRSQLSTLFCVCVEATEHPFYKDVVCSFSLRGNRNCTGRLFFLFALHSYSLSLVNSSGNYVSTGSAFGQPTTQA